MIAHIAFRPSSTASPYSRCLVRFIFLRKSPTRRTRRPTRITLPSHRNSPTTYQRLYPVSATSSSRTRPLSFLRAFRYWLDHALITALLSLIVNLILPPVQTFRAGHFTQISYVRQRMGFTQIFDEAIRAIAVLLIFCKTDEHENYSDHHRAWRHHTPNPISQSTRHLCGRSTDRGNDTRRHLVATCRYPAHRVIQ